MSVGRNTGRVSRQTLSGRLRSGGRSGAAYGRTAGQQDEGEQRPIDDAVRSMDSAAARFKQMSAVTAAAVAVAVVAVGYGLWQAGASRAAVDQATKGARSVVVTTRDVAAGDPFGADAVQLVEVPQAFRQDDALGADALDGAGSVAGARALVSIPANTQLSPQMIAGSAADGRLAAQLAAGMEAVSLSVNDETGVAGQVQPFDEVRVVCVTEAAGGAVSLDELCASARVMSVGGDGAGEGAAYSAITLELTPEQADAVRCAQASGTISVQSSSLRAACCREVWSSMMDRGTELALKRAVREGLATRLQGDFDPVEVESAIQSLVQEAVRAWNLGLAEPDVARLCRSVGDDFLRYGPLQGLLEDPGITEIIVNGGGVAMDAGVARFLEPHVFVERAGRLEPCPYVRFDDADHLRRIIDKIAEQAGMRCDEAHAMGCAMLPGGKARATYIVPPLAPDGPALNLRLFGDDAMSIEDLTARGALSPVMAEFLGSAVRARCPVIISGGTGSGKTTMLGALSGFIPDDERVLTIEDTPELRLRAAHVERMQTREANTEGEGAVGMRELVALSLRRRPDRIIVGECRGAEAYEMLQAMQTDHPGSMTTVHANDPGNALSRLRTMVGYANADLGRDVIVQQIAESLAGGLIVHVERMRDGGRRVTSIVAVDQMPEGATVVPRAELFRFEPRGMDAFGRITGAWRACGVQPQRIKQRMLAAGVRFDPSWFFGS